MNEVQDMISDLHALAQIALEALQGGDLDECGRVIKDLIGELQEQMDDSE